MRSAGCRREGQKKGNGGRGVNVGRTPDRPRTRGLELGGFEEWG
jgi:hypothetical protein